MKNMLFIKQHFTSVAASRSSIVPSSFPNYRRHVIILILLLSAFRGILGFVLELGNDETYYWLYSQYLQWNYFDHPPMVAVWIRIFTLNLLLDDFEGFIRLGSVIGCALSTWFMYKTVALIKNERAGWFAAILYNASFYAGITAGLYILPDSPQMVFWTFGMWTIVKIINDENNWWHWMVFGMAMGLCIMSKVHGVFLWGGFGLWIIFFKLSWFKKPQLYLSICITLVLISPIFIWNLTYDFATWNYHSQRVDVDHFIIRWQSFAKQIASQVGFNNPINTILIVWAIFQWKNFSRHQALRIYNLAGIPLALILLVVSLFRDTPLPHWSGPAYVSLIPLAAVHLSEINKKLYPNVLRWALGIFMLVYTTWAVLVQYLPGTYSKDKESLGRGDITVDMFGWEDAGNQFKAVYENDIKKGLMPANSPMVTSHWWGAHIEYYFCRPLGIPMIGLGTIKTGHYLWLNKKRAEGVDVNRVYCVVPSTDRYRIPIDFYKTIEMAGVINIRRNGKPAHSFFIYRLKGLKKEVPVR